jgi:gliding motility-associated-like protein
MKKFSYYILLLLCLIISSLSPTIAQEMPTSTARFIQNKGQWDNFFDYRLRLYQGEMLFAKDKFIYILHEDEYFEAFGHHHDKEHKHTEGEMFDAHAYQVSFENANPNVNITEKQKYPDYNNYYLGNDPKKWASHVEIFGELWYENLYNGVDMNTYGVKEGLKYNFIVQPNINPDVIQLKYEGIEDISIKKGNLVLKTSFTEVKELAPIAYQIINGKKVEVPCEYKLSGKTLSFSFPKGYDKTELLTIDPTVVFSTYTGSTQDNWGFTATYDNNGNGYGGGIIWSGFTGQAGYPLLGAFQTSYQGGQMDATITKYNPTGGALIFSTYLGGSQSDQPHSLVVDDQENLLVFGRTSSANFPTSAGCYDASHNGGYDIYVTKFSSIGQFLASTFIGGSGDDGVNIDPNEVVIQDIKYNYADDARGEIIVDDLNNCYVASCTKSSNFPTTTGCFRPTYSGVQDGLVLKLNPNLTSLVWSSFIGGSAADAAYSLQLDDQYQVYVAGGTMSTNFPASPSGVLHSTYRGGMADGFIGKVSANGSTLMACSYLGTSSYDQAYFVQLDKYNAVYIMGQSNGAYPVVGSVYTNTNSRQFITKLDNNLSTILVSTVFGKPNSTLPNISPTAFLVDKCKNVYVAGWGGSLFGYNVNSSGTNGLPVTSNAYDATTDNQDFYIIVLNKDFQSLVYATFFGGTAGEHVDGGTSRFDKQGIIFEAVCASCGGGSTFPTTAGAYSGTNNSSNCNLALFKIDLEVSVLDSDFQPTQNGNVITNSAGCAPFTVEFENYTQGTNILNTTYYWDFGILPAGTATSTAFEPTYTYTTAGTYTVMLISIDSTSCNLRDTVYRTITVWGQPIADAGPPQSICLGSTQGVTLQGSGSGTIPVYSYSWYPSTNLAPVTSATPNATPSSTTTYSLVVTDGNGCKDTSSVTVSVNSQAVVNAGPDAVLCGTGSASTQLNASGANLVTYSWTPPTGLSNPNISNPTASPPNTTSYIVYGIDAQGCIGKDTVVVTISTPVGVNAGSDVNICFGANTPLQAQQTLGGSVSYAWSPVTGLSNPNISNPVANPSNTTTYTVTITDAIGCTASDNVTVNVSPQIIIDAGPATFFCPGNTAQLNAVSNIAGTFSWSPATGLSNGTILNPIANPSQTTTYTLFVTDGLGCVVSDNVTVNVPIQLIINAGNDTSICFGTPGQLNVQLLQGANVFYNWTPAGSLSSATISNPVATPTTTTTYNVTVTDPFGCNVSDNITISVNPQITVNAGPDTFFCPGNNVQLSATTNTNGLYAWTPSAGLSNSSILNPLATPSNTTNYVLTVTDGVGCKGKDSLIVTVPPVLSVNAGKDTFVCYGQPVPLNAQQLSGGTATFVWSPTTSLSNPNILNPVATPTDTITYTLTLTDNYGCVKSDAVTVNVNKQMIVVASPDTMICIGNSIQIFANSNTTNVLYSWYPPTYLTMANIANPTAVAPSNITYNVQIKDQNGCTAGDSTKISVFETFTIPDTVICAGDSVQLNAFGGTVFNWTPNYNLTNANIPNPIAFPMQTTTYTLNAGNNLGCVSTKTVTIGVQQLPDADAGADKIICLGITVQLEGSGGYFYTWNPPTALSNPNIFNPLATPTDTIMYSLMVQDSLGCTQYDTVIVNVMPLPSVTASPNETICFGDSTQIFAFGAPMYQWATTNTLSNLTVSNPIAFPAQTTLYTVTGTDTYGCKDTGQVKIQVIPPAKTKVEGPSGVCPTRPITVFASGGESYVWNTGDSTYLISLVPTVSQWYVCTAYTGDCPGIPDSVYVNVWQEFPDAQFTYSPDTAFAPAPITFQNNSTDAKWYSWTWGTGEMGSDEENPTHVFTRLGEYTVMLVAYSQHYCTDTIRNKVYLEGVTIYAPSAFSPNNDGYNDEFLIKYYGINFSNIRIYNRWGEMIYESADKDFRWDGSYKNQPVPEGVYVWVIDALGENGLKYPLQGTVTLIR